MAGCSNNQRLENTEDGNAGVSLPAGYEAIIDGRQVTLNSNGDIYVSLRNIKNGEGIAGTRDTNQDGIADLIENFGNFTGTGIVIHNG